MSTDLDLIARIKQREQAALSELYDRYSTRVYSLAVSIVGESMTAQEVTQDVFIRVWEHPDQYRYDDHRFVAWLLMIARHRAIDHLRREKSRGDASAASLDDTQFPEMPDSAQAVEEKWRDMRHVLDGLPPEQRDVIVLAYYHGLSQSEIAAHLNWPLGTVKTRMRLGMDKLRDAIRVVD